MRWNNNVLIVFGAVAGAFAAAFVIAIVQSSSSHFDLDAFGKIAEILVVPLTLGLVAFTAVLARETRQMWMENRKPHVIVTIEPNEDLIQWMDIVVENVGGGTAFDVVATPDPDIVRQQSMHVIKVSQSSLLRLPVLKPRQRFSTFVGEWSNMQPQKTTFHCQCRDFSGDRYEFTNEVDLASFKTLLSTNKQPIEDIAKELEKIRRAITDRLEVNTHNAEDREVEEAERQRQFRDLEERVKGRTQPSRGPSREPSSGPTE